MNTAKLVITFIITSIFGLFENIEAQNLEQSKRIEISKDSLPRTGHDFKDQYFFKEVFQFDNLSNYLDNLNDFVTYQSETTGNFNLPDLYLFSVSGNSYKSNKYYLNGFRVDSRSFSGSSYFQPDLFTHSLDLDYYRSELKFNSSTKVDQSISLSYNTGGIGGISPFTEDMVHWFHQTATDRMYQPINDRSKMSGAVSLKLNFNIPTKNSIYLQQLSADRGSRYQVGFNQNGINDYYPETFTKFQAEGQLPIDTNAIFDQISYIGNISLRDHLYTELYYSKNESAKNSHSSLSVYGKKKIEEWSYIIGFSYSNNQINHYQLNFTRNLVDQDGEAFEPWYPNGITLDFSHFLNLTKEIGPNLKVKLETYNSVLSFMPGESSFYNTVYAQNIGEDATSLYIYDWNTQKFTSGLLENSLGLHYNKTLSNNWDLSTSAEITLDGILIGQKSLISPNLQGRMAFHYHPNNWFSMEINIDQSRMSYNYDDIKYFSDDYLNGEVYYWKDTNKDLKYTSNEKSDFYTNTGGSFHQAATDLKQATVFTLDIPLYFQFGKNRVSIMNTLRKYNNNWWTVYDKDASYYGFYDNNQNFFLNNHRIEYIVQNQSTELMKSDYISNFITNSPFYLSNNVKWDYTSKHIFFSFAFCQYLMSGLSGLGNGPLHNNVGVYSESTANPNVFRKLIGRTDQDRAYVARMLFSYIYNENWSISVSGKFKDGQPFSSFDYSLNNQDNNTQIAIWSTSTKGIHPFNLEFGTRKDAFFNFDFRLNYKNQIGSKNYQVQLMCYNIYDFGTELTEYVFDPIAKNRNAMSLNIPRGIIANFKYDF